MEVPGRILAIDPGTKRLGLALSDDLRMTASPFEVYRRRSLKEDLQYLSSIVAEHEVTEILFGLPYRLGGGESDSTARAKTLLEAVKQHFAEKVIITIRDEALTTWQAEQFLIEKGVKQKDRQKNIDAYAAACLLQEELDCRDD